MCAHCRSSRGFRPAHNQFGCQLVSCLADKFSIARWKTHLAAVSALRDRGALCFVIISCQCITSSLAPYLDTGAKTSKSSAAVDNSHYPAGIYLSCIWGMNTVRCCNCVCQDPPSRDHLQEDLELGGACPAFLLLSALQLLLVAFLLPSCL